MSERPILFSGPMVRALLAGTKSQTRRVFKEAEPHWRRMTPEEWMAATPNRPAIGGYPKPPKFPALFWDRHCGVAFPCPHGVPGDRLWVRETFAEKLAHTGRPLGWAYRADGERAAYELGKWSPSIFMPRAASRITLEVTDVRVERVQEISEEDAKAEGVQMIDEIPEPPEWWSYRKEFGFLWNEINAKRGYGWEVNPWVWVINFKRIKP